MKYTKKEASEIIANMILTSGLVTEKHNNALSEITDGSLYREFLNSESLLFEVFGVWGANATLHIDRKDGVTLSWSSTNRSIAMASTTIALYKRVLQLGTKIQAFMDCATIMP